MAVQLPKTIRQWFTPEQACQYLSQAFECEVELSDLEYFCDVKQLSVMAKLNQQKELELNSMYDLENFFCFHYAYTVPDDPEFCGKLIITYHINAGIYPVRIDTHGISLFRFANNLYRGVENVEFRAARIDLLDSAQLDYPEFSDFDITKKEINKITVGINKPSGLFTHQYDSILIFDLNEDDDFEIGFTRHELNRFIQAQTEPTPETREPKELNTNERNSLHALIYALTLKDVEADLQSAVPHDTGASKTDTASKIKARLDKQGINLTAKTIREHIKNAHETAQELKK